MKGWGLSLALTAKLYSKLVAEFTISAFWLREATAASMARLRGWGPNLEVG